MSEQCKFDVFMCHNSEDKAEVKKVAHKLKEFGLKPWLDKWELIPGRSWSKQLEQQIGEVSSAAVFIGESGIGPWQDQEIRALLQQFSKRNCPIIPVLLQNSPKEPELPIFLEDMGWVDFRQKQTDPIGQLFWGITGHKLSDYLQNKLITLLKQKDDLEIEIKKIEQKLDAVQFLTNQHDSDLQVLLDWLSNIRDVAVMKEYGETALKKFPNLRSEVVEEGNLEEFYMEISCYLDFIYLSTERDDQIFIDEPALPPTLANSEIYKSACFDVYNEFFRIIKYRIPERIESRVTDKLGANVDFFLKRLKPPS